MDPEHDRKVSEHVLRMHRYRNPGEQDGEGMKPVLIFGTVNFYPYFSPALPLGGFADMLGTGSLGLQEDEEEKEDTPIFEKHDKMLHGKDRYRSDFSSCVKQFTVFLFAFPLEERLFPWIS